MGLRGLPTSPMVERRDAEEDERRWKIDQKKKLKIGSRTSYQASHYGVGEYSLTHTNHVKAGVRGPANLSTLLAPLSVLRCLQHREQPLGNRGWRWRGGKSGKEKSWLGEERGKKEEKQRRERDRAACVASRWISS